jgi:hypothetical protein
MGTIQQKQVLQVVYHDVDLLLSYYGKHQSLHLRMLRLVIPARTLVRLRLLHGEIQMQVKIIRIQRNITDLDQVAPAIMRTSIMYMVTMVITGRTLGMLRMGMAGMDIGGDIERSLRLRLWRKSWIWKMKRQIRGLM